MLALRTSFAAFVLLAAASAASCASEKSGGERACNPGESVACTGPGGCKGGQVCDQGRGFGPCLCSDGGAGASGAAGAGGGSGGSSGASGAAGSGSLPPREVSCDYYCAVIARNCKDTDLQYQGEDNCITACLGFPGGTLEDDAGNTLGCRIRAAEDAETAPTLKCPIAGPSGNGGCGSPCDGYCSIFGSVCSSDAEAFADESACQAACATFGSSGDPYDVGQTSGATVECRLYHVTAAAQSAGSAPIHCPHARATPTANCL